MELGGFVKLWKRYNRTGNDRRWKVSLVEVLDATGLDCVEVARLCLQSGKTLATAVEFAVIIAALHADGRELRPVMEMLCTEFVGRGKLHSREVLFSVILSVRGATDTWRGWMLNAAGFARPSVAD